MTDTDIATDPVGAQLFATMPFTEGLGVRVLGCGPELVRSRLEWRENLCTLGGSMHGVRSWHWPMRRPRCART